MNIQNYNEKMADINKISGSKYDIYDKFMTLGKHYFGQDTDYLKGSFMNYITECMALVMRDSVLHKSVLYKESFLNTAILPSSVYNWAKMFNIEVAKAKPAFSDIMLTINIDELELMYNKKTGNSFGSEKYGRDVLERGENHIFIIDRDNPLIVGNFFFSLERSVLIYKENESWVVKYCRTESEKTHFGDFSETYLKTAITSSGNSSYLSFIVRVWQYKTTEIQKQITSSSFADTKIHTFDFTDQLAGLRLRYKKNNVIREIPLIFADSLQNENELYAYYSIIDDHKVEIKFMNNVFLPSVGGTLLVDLFSTLGSKGNYTFSSDLSFTLKDEDYRSLAISATFTDYQSYAGTDTPTLQQIKQSIISDISTRNIIVTESDLNNYFFKLASLLESVNDGKVEFIKKNDDIIKRTFNAYLLLRTGLTPYNELSSGSGYRSPVIPTNTIDINFPITENISKPFGSLVAENLDSQNGLVTYNYVPDDFKTENNDNYYVIPFYMRVLLNPIKRVKYLYNIANDSCALKYIDIKSSTNKMIMTPSEVSVVRELDGTNVSDTYKISFSFATNFQLDVDKNFDKLDLHIFETKNSSRSISLKTNTEYCSKQIISNKDNNSNIYRTTIIAYLKVNPETEFSFDSLDEYGTKIKFADSGTCSENAHVGLSLAFSQEDEYFDISVKSDSALGFFRSLDGIMSSDIVINTKHDEESGKDIVTSILVKEVPVVHSSFFNKDSNKTKFVKQLFTYIDLLKENIKVLETNTSFNLKFMNTYGYSKKYSTNTTNLNLEMTIYLTFDNKNENAELSQKIEREIRDYIRVLVDKYNNDKEISVSTIITLVTAAYSKYIDHIVFEGLNGTFTQYIPQLEISDKIYVPEYLNLDSKLLEKSIKFSYYSKK